MSTTHERMLFRGPVELTKILGLSMAVRGNEHGVMTVTGYLDPEKVDSSIFRDIQGQAFCFCAPTYADSDTLYPIFYGSTKSINVQREGNVFYVELSLQGMTVGLDTAPKSRSFQNVDMTYQQVVEAVLSDTPGATAQFSDAAGHAIGEPLIQYEETDWNFLKRLASMVGTQLLPDCTAPVPRFSFGVVPQSQKNMVLDKYTILLDKRFYEMGSSTAGLYKPDFLCYLTSSTQYYGFGSQVVVDDQPLVICELDGRLIGSEIVYAYKIGRPGLFHHRLIRNEKLTGLHLDGTVTKTEYEIVNLKLDIDAGRDAGFYPFHWTPESGNIMYCMPKLGTRATLYIPDQGVDEAVALTSPRVNGDDCPAMADPQMRIFTTEHGKVMALYPESIQFSGGAPKESLQIQLNQLDSMMMVSTRAVQLVAQMNIDISAPLVALNSPQEIHTARSQIQAQTKVSLIIPKGTGCGNPPTGGGDTTMVMQFQFDVLSQVNVSHGTEFREYDLFDDAPENFNFGGWITNIVIGVAVAAVCVLGAVFTGGLLGAALLGAAIGAAAVTATIAIEDKNDGEVRSVGAAVSQIAVGAAAGAIVGATGAYVMPYGVGTIGTQATFGMLSGATMRVATSGAMEHMDMVDRLGYIFNPLYVAGDALGAAFLGGLANRSALGTAFPTQEMVSSYNAARQSALKTAQAARTAQDTSDTSAPPPKQVKTEGEGVDQYRPTETLRAHIENVDPSVPRRRGIGGAHNRESFMQNDIKIVSETPHPDIDGVTTIQYQMPKLDKAGTPIPGQYQSGVPKVKTVYNPEILSTEEYLARGLQAANNAASQYPSGVLPREWVGVDEFGVTWRGYCMDGDIISMFPE